MSHIIKGGWYVFNPQKAGRVDADVYKMYFRGKGWDISAPYQATYAYPTVMHLAIPNMANICVTSAYYDLCIPNKSVEDWL